MEIITIIAKEQFYTVYKKNDKLALIDVRSPVEFQSHHIKGSFNIPLENISSESVRQLLAEHNILNDEAVYLICKSGMRAKKAQQQIQGLSQPVICIEQGLDGMKSDNEVNYNDSDNNVISLERQVRIAAGALTVTGILLGMLIHPAGYGLAGFIGSGLIFARITDWCGMGLLMAKMPWNKAQSC